MLPGWNCLEYLSTGRGDFSREKFSEGDFHGINFPKGIFCGSSFLLGIGVFLEKLFAGGLKFRHGFKNNLFK